MTMEIATVVESLLGQVSEKNMAKGLALAEDGGVAPAETRDQTLRGWVEDPARGKVHVQIDWARGLSWYCQCGSNFYGGSKMCAHAWALLVAADSQGWLGEDAYTAMGREGRKRPTQSLAAAGAAWKQRLNRVEALARDSTPEGRRAWPDNRELVYVVDAERSMQSGGGLDLQVMTRDRKSDGTPGKLKVLKVREP